MRLPLDQLILSLIKLRMRLADLPEVKEFGADGNGVS